ncbi:uncharacterized protein LOC134183132 [Corticium candelabrum]|uniref:uncharacterized protein LOC134183132 n=1 Tax=Corticium candelabrum TaxID=121492 RepID=UPI002E264CA2|nr:uncharacterized protein LOC134183132 [Corticium candelabrum]
MICIILVAGHGVQLEKEIKVDKSGVYSNLQGVPKALLPGIGDTKILDLWWEAINTRRQFVNVFLVTNADKYKYYERWATANDFPVENIINDGTTTYDTRLGAVADFHLCLKIKKIKDDVMVVAGDMLFFSNFDIAQVLDYFKWKQGDLAVCYELDATECTQSRGIVEMDADNRITRFLEKPDHTQTESRLASVVFYCFHKDSLTLVDKYMAENTHMDQLVFGKFFEWFVQQTPVYGMKLPTRFQLIGQISLEEYRQQVEGIMALALPLRERISPIRSKSYARIGLIGNPSDGFYGKTISMSISNFWAEVTIVESEKLVLTPHKLNDPTEFGGLSDLHWISRKEGYLGGLRLLQATCKKFYEYCASRGIALAKRNFTLSYETNIPRQVGLAGSSAIVVATLNCLMRFFNLTGNDLPKALRPEFVLNVEREELFIQAGLQDRVIQVYEGLVYMDFAFDLIRAQGHGLYMNLEMSQLPQFWLAYQSNPSDSGRIHSNVKARWDSGDEEVHKAMKQFAELASNSKDAIEKKDWETLALLMNDNFDLRRKVYGDKALGSRNLEMIEVARKHGSAAKFPGSGGAVIGLCLDPQCQASMKEELLERGFVVCDIVPFDGNSRS